MNSSLFNWQEDTALDIKGQWSGLWSCIGRQAAESEDMSGMRDLRSKLGRHAFWLVGLGPT